MAYITKRAVTLIITLFLISVFAFAAFNIVPGDPAQLMLGADASTEQIDALHEKLGLDKSMGERYFDWIGGILKGDCGNSIKYDTPVLDLIKDRLPVTFAMSIIAMILIIAIGIPTGIYTVKHKDSFLGRAISLINMANISIPNFFLGILIIWLFGVVLNLFQTGSYVDYKEDIFGFIYSIIFPAITVAIPNIAIVVKFLRSSINEEMNKPYVRTAYSKGNSENRVLYRHVLKNALIPVITLLGMIIAEIFSGSIIVEQVFQIPGIGRLLISSVTSRDFPLVETIVVYIGFIVVIVNTLVDILLQYINPQIKIK